MAISILGVALGLSLTEILLVSCLLLATMYYFYATRYHGVWEKVGIPGPKPWPLVDHKYEIRELGGHNGAIKKWFAKYGKTFGAYGLMPHRAVLVTKDLELIKQVLVKDLDNFNNRYRSSKSASSFSHGLTSAVNDTWRRQRHVTSPIFTGGKMKMMMDHVSASAGTLTEIMQQCARNGETINLKDFANKYSAEVIARIGFGVTTHAVSKEESEFAYYARNLVGLKHPMAQRAAKLAAYFPHLFPVLLKLSSKFDFIWDVADAYFVNILKYTMNARKEERAKTGVQKTRDILDLLMEAEVEENDPRLTDNTSKVLNPSEVIGNSVVLILAGVETVSATFQSLMCCLAMYPDIQDKVIAEIDSVIPPGENVQYEHLPLLKYTEQVISECLRIYPILATLSRVTAETKTYNGITIPKSTVVQIPNGLIMMDPEYFPDPEKFDPERFSPENKAARDPIAYMPFGYGPRICLGQRLALMELKTITASLLKKVRLTLSERTEPKKGEKMKIELRGGIIVAHIKPVTLEPLLRA